MFLMMNRVPCHDGPKWNQRISLTRLFGISSDEDRLKTFDMLNSDCMIKKEGGGVRQPSDHVKPLYSNLLILLHMKFS